MHKISSSVHKIKNQCWAFQAGETIKIGETGIKQTGIGEKEKLMSNDTPHIIEDKTNRKVHPRAINCFVISIIPFVLLFCIAVNVRFSLIETHFDVMLLFFISCILQPFGILLGIFSLHRIRRKTRYCGKRYAIAGIILSSLAIYGALLLIHQRQENYERQFANALYDNAAIDLQKRVIAVYEERLGLDFPDSTRILFANADKGDLLDVTYAAALKMEIDSKDRDSFEAGLQSSNGTLSPSDEKWLLDSFHAPRRIWNPQSLKDCHIYSIPSRPMSTPLYIGTDEDGAIIIYLCYGTI